MNDQLPDIGRGSWLLHSMMEMQKTQGQLVEAVQSLREGQRDTQVLVGAVANDVGTLTGEVGNLKQDVGTLKQDVGTLKLDVGALRQDMGTLKQDVGTVRREVATLAQKVNTAQTVVWIVGVGLAGTFGFVGWLITNAIAVLPSVLSQQ